jgi:hypothetical protein
MELRSVALSAHSQYPKLSPALLTPSVTKQSRLPPARPSAPTRTGCSPDQITHATHSLFHLTAGRSPALNSSAIAALGGSLSYRATASAIPVNPKSRYVH